MITVWDCSLGCNFLGINWKFDSCNSKNKESFCIISTTASLGAIHIYLCSHLVVHLKPLHPPAEVTNGRSQTSLRTSKEVVPGHCKCFWQYAFPNVSAVVTFKL